MWHWVNRLMMSRMQQWAVKHEILIVHDSAGNYGKCRHMSVMLWSHKVKINKSVKKKLLEKKINQWQHNDGEMHTDLWPPWFYVLLYNAHTHTHTHRYQRVRRNTLQHCLCSDAVCVCYTEGHQIVCGMSGRGTLKVSSITICSITSLLSKPANQIKLLSHASLVPQP